MLNPSVTDLLSGVANTLRHEVLPGVEPGPATDQLRDAIAVIRRVARAMPVLTPMLVEDGHDLAAALSLLGIDDPTPTDAADLPSGDAMLDLVELTHRNLAMRKALADHLDGSELTAGQDAEVRALLARLTEREASLRLSPWER